MPAPEKVHHETNDNQLDEKLRTPNESQALDELLPERDVIITRRRRTMSAV